LKSDGPDSVFTADAAIALARINRNGIRKTLIVPPPFSADVRGKYAFEQIIPAIAAHRDRFGFLAGGGSLSPMILSTPPDRVTEEIRLEYGPKPAHKLAIKLLDQLPDRVARALAYENAQRIYRLAQ
jgi:hypothetical protein